MPAVVVAETLARKHRVPVDWAPAVAEAIVSPKVPVVLAVLKAQPTVPAPPGVPVLADWLELPAEHAEPVAAVPL